MKDIFKTFGVGFAYATGIVAGLCAGPKIVEKVGNMLTGKKKNEE